VRRSALAALAVLVAILLPLLAPVAPGEDSPGEGGAEPLAASVPEEGTGPELDAELRARYTLFEGGSPGPPLPLPRNASYPLAPGWRGNGTISLAGISEKRDRVAGGSLDRPSDFGNWTFFNETGYTAEIRNTELEYLYISIETDRVDGARGWFEQNITVQEPLAAGTTVWASVSHSSASLGKEGYPATKFRIFLEVSGGGVTKGGYSEDVSLYDGWNVLSFSVPSSAFGDPPSEWCVRAGVELTGNEAATRKSRSRLDDIQLLFRTPVDGGDLAARNATAPEEEYRGVGTDGLGSIQLDQKAETEEYRTLTYEIFDNSSSHPALAAANVTIEADLETNLTGGGESLYWNNATNVLWEAPISVPAFPSSYDPVQISVSKPSDWVVYAVLDPRDIDLVANVTNTASGTEEVIIPGEVVMSGQWVLLATSENYLTSARVVDEARQDIGEALPGDEISFQVNMSEGDLGGNVTLELFDGAGALVWSRDAAAAGTISFGPVSVGSGWAPGEASAWASWGDGEAAPSKLGFASALFSMVHRSALSPRGGGVSAVRGETASCRVFFNDTDTGLPIAFAEVNYTLLDASSDPVNSGRMDYVGSGEYLCALDTSKLEVGNYTFDFTGRAEYYERADLEGGAALQVLPESLVVSLSPGALENVTVGESFALEANVTGKETGFPIEGAQLECGWPSPCNWSESRGGIDGIYLLNVSTEGLLEGSSPVALEIKVKASKQSRSGSSLAAVEILPLSSSCLANETSLPLSYWGSGSIALNYTGGDGGPIPNASWTVEGWSGGYSLEGEGWAIELQLDAAGVPGGVHKVTVTAVAPAYYPASRAVPVSVSKVAGYVEIDEESLTVIRGDTGNITCRFRAEGGADIPDATVEALGGTINGTLAEGGGIYSLAFPTAGLVTGSYPFQILGESSFASPALQDAAVLVEPLRISVSANTTFADAGSSVLVTAVDESHGVPLAGWTVSYECAGRRGNLTADEGGKALLRIAALALPPSPAPHDLTFSIENPYGVGGIAEVTVAVSPDLGEGDIPFFLAASLTTGALALLAAASFCAKVRYLDQTGLQRRIKKIKGRGNKYGRKIQKSEAPKGAWRSEALARLIRKEFREPPGCAKAVKK
jgi:hypothetical protein